MAEIVTVAVNDTISKIVKSKRRVKPNEEHPWTKRVLALNPHIGHPDRIYPNDKLLLPESLNEPVSDEKKWQNALSHVPAQLRFHPPMNYEIPVQVIMPGDAIESLAKQAFVESRFWNVPATVQRAVFMHNNPRLQHCTGFIPLPAGTLANMTPFMLPANEVRQWEVQHPIFRVEFEQLRPEVREIYTTIGPTPTYLMGKTVLNAHSAGAAVGLDDVLAGAAAGYTVAGNMVLNQINALMHEVTHDAVRKFGRGVVCSNKVENVRLVERFLKAHPKHAQLMRYLSEVPKHLLPEAVMADTIATTKSPYANAGFMRKQVFMPTLKPNGANYMGTIKAGLNTSTKILKVGSRGTLVIPIVLATGDVINAAPELRMRTLFEEGFGVIGGYAGAALGVQVIGLGIVTILGLGPFGAFIALFLCATGAGLIGSELFKWGGRQFYDIGDQLGGHYFSSANEFLGAF